MSAPKSRILSRGPLDDFSNNPVANVLDKNAKPVLGSLQNEDSRTHHGSSSRSSRELSSLGHHGYTSTDQSTQTPETGPTEMEDDDKVDVNIDAKIKSIAHDKPLQRRRSLSMPLHTQGGDQSPPVCDSSELTEHSTCGPIGKRSASAGQGQSITPKHRKSTRSSMESLRVIRNDIMVNYLFQQAVQKSLISPDEL